MPATSPDNLVTPEGGDPFLWYSQLASLATDVQNALTRRANAYRGTTAQMNALPTPPVGSLFYNTSTASLMVYRSGNWEAVFSRAGLPTAMASGQVEVYPTANEISSASVVFPVGRFSITPNIVVAPMTQVPATTLQGFGYQQPTPSGFNVYVLRSNSTMTIISWVAVQN